MGQSRHNPIGPLRATRKAIGVCAEAVEHGFKKDADLVTPLSDEEAEALSASLKAHPDGSPEAYIWPRRCADRRIDPAKAMYDNPITAMRQRFAKRWSLPWLRSKDLRHYVRTVLNHSGMPTVERNYWQGHTPDMSDMDQRYGDVFTEEVLESQRRYLPSGVVGTFVAVTVTDDVPSAWTDIYRRLQTKQITPSEGVEAAQAIVRQAEKALLVR